MKPNIISDGQILPQEDLFVSDERLFAISPEKLTEKINFSYGDTSWAYRQSDDFSIPKIQAEGTAKLWNTLLEKKIALLSDEVGMGKTFQGLGIMATLWQQKSDAKVLLYAPNENVAQKWIREYNNFIRYNYSVTDNLVKSAIHGMQLRKAVYCENHLQLMQYANLMWPSFLVCKTSSLSGFLSPRVTNETLYDIGLSIKKSIDEKSPPGDQAKWMCAYGLECNDRMYELFSKDRAAPFDLIIFDEAHYLRRSDGDTNRGIAAHAFFAGRNILEDKHYTEHRPLADKVLLLTATPNHSSPEDIRSITSLFNPAFRKKNPTQILQEICVRRFRRLGGKTKHEYREEITSPVSMEHLRERLFFAAYHKALVKAKAEDVDKQKSRLDNPYRVLFGYLEGFEFLPQKMEISKKKQKQVDGTDFHQRDDSEVIVNLSNIFHRAYKTRPEHPKYRKITENLQPSIANQYAPEKRLVFVRRIASVYEISSRIIEFYDEAYSELLKSTLTPKELVDFRKDPRRFYYKLSKGEAEKEHEEPQTTHRNKKKEVEQISDIQSTILSLFTVWKEKRPRTTDCSNFRLRFLKKDQIFSFFFEPPLDYEVSPQYQCNYSLQKEPGKREYKATAQHHRLARLSENDVRRIVLEQHFGLDDAEFEKTPAPGIPMETLITIWLSFTNEKDKSKVQLQKSREEYLGFSIYEKEAFTEFLEKGILFSSQHIVRFYVLYRKIMLSEPLKGEELYAAFCAKIRETIESSGLAELISKAVLSFRIFYRKELGHTDDGLLRESWSFLKNTLPVFPVCGDTNRDSIRKAFNTPFYPDVLVSTSVLQEGVDLHYQCSEVIHYGIAWTQGDNEQRVGRVDRMFGKLESDLIANPETTLPIHYPYLRNTIDQDQLARFILRKHESEKLLDRLKNVGFSNEINFREQISEDVWTRCLNKPGNHIIEKDPFPVDYERDFNGISPPDTTEPIAGSIEGYLDPLLNSIQDHFGEEFLLIDRKTLKDEDKKLFAIRHIRPNKRHQPVIGELGHSEEGLYFLKQPVYFIRITTPLSRNKRNIDIINKYKLIKETYNDNPLLKICLDQAGNDYFRYYVCADLPLFQLSNQAFNLSFEEIIAVIDSVIGFADDLEQIISSGDIRNEYVLDKIQAQSTIRSSNTLTANRGVPIPKTWRRSASGMFVYKQKEERLLPYEEMYSFNHKNLFLRKINDSGVTRQQVGIYQHDALTEECELLEKLLSASID